MGFFETCEEIRTEINKKDNFLVIHHYDADGLSAGAITCSGLIKMGKDYTRESFKKISENEIEEDTTHILCILILNPNGIRWCRPVVRIMGKY